jgi:serine protease Do
MFCLSISLSLIIGAIAGAIVAGGINIFEGIMSPTVDNVKSEAIVQINPEKIDHGAIVNATELAYNSVVTINVFADEEMASENKSSGAGSGVIYTKDGYILTCNHVVEGFDIIKVNLANGDYYYADVVGADSQTDIAVIKVKATDLSACVVRDWEAAPITIGETAIVIGNPLGVLGHSVTSGIISGLSRNINVDGQSMTLLQTDASINAGNSGGGIFDINGSLIGIVNAKTTGATIDNLGFAVPIDTVYSIAKELIENGYVTGRPGLNLGTVEVNTSNYINVLRSYPALEKYVVKEYTKLPFGYTQINEIYTGLFVVDASTVKYAEKTANNFKFGDKIVQVVNSSGAVTEITDLQSLSNVIQSQNIGDELQFTVYREGSYLTVTVVLVEQMS